MNNNMEIWTIERIKFLHFILKISFIKILLGLLLTLVMVIASCDSKKETQKSYKETTVLLRKTANIAKDDNYYKEKKVFLRIESGGHLSRITDLIFFDNGKKTVLIPGIRPDILKSQFFKP